MFKPNFFNLAPFHIVTNQVEKMTSEQMANARHRIACNFGARGGLSPIAYMILLISLALMTEQGLAFLQSYWYLELLLLMLTLGRLVVIKKLIKSDKNNYPII